MIKEEKKALAPNRFKPGTSRLLDRRSNHFVTTTAALARPSDDQERHQVVPVDVVLHHEVEGPERSDERTRDGEHHGHAEEQHHARVLLAEPELVADGVLQKNGGISGLKMIGDFRLKFKPNKVRIT